MSYSAPNGRRFESREQWEQANKRVVFQREGETFVSDLEYALKEQKANRGEILGTDPRTFKETF